MFLALIDSPGPKPSSHAITNNGMNIKLQETLGKRIIKEGNRTFQVIMSGSGITPLNISQYYKHKHDN